MKRTKKQKATVYLAPRVLQVLAVGGDTAGLNYALGAFAGLLYMKGREAASRFTGDEWELLRDALDESCWELPTDGTSWNECVSWAVDDHSRQVEGIDGRQKNARRKEWDGILAKLERCDELECFAILVAVRFCERLGPYSPADGVAWYDPSARLRNSPTPPAEIPPAQPEKPKRKKA